MELTRDNYYEIEPKILKDIDNCEFIAFDLEFSGLIPSKFKIYDSPEENFQKSKIMAENFRIIQLGITPFIRKENNEKAYIAKPYNIYVFPSEKQSNNKFDFFLDSVIFNREHGCDFNKWINKGVSYLNNENLKKLTERIMSGNINKYDPKNMSSFKNIVLYKEQDKIKYKNFLDKFNNFYNNPEEKVFKHEKIVRHLVLYFLNKLNENIRKLIFIEYKDEIIGEETKSFILIHKLNSYEEKIQRINKENNEIFTTVEKEKGVKNIIEKIISSKKPIIGHNCYIDLIFIMSHFMDEIPNNYSSYKKRLKNEFKGGIYDTKYLYNSSNFNFGENKNESNDKINNIHLECLYTKLFDENKKLENDKKINIEIPNNENFIDYLDEKNKTIKFHQADYDAFTSGCAFIFMKNILGEKSIQDTEGKLNCYRGLYSCYDLNNIEINEKYLYNSSDAYVLIFNEKSNITNDIMMEINEKVVMSKYVNYKTYAKEIGGTCIVLISSENKNDFIQICSKFKDYFIPVNILEYKEALKNKNNNK